MAAIADLSDLVNRMTGGNSGTPELVYFTKNYTVQGGAADTWAAGVLYSTWRYDGLSGAGATPGAVAVPTKETAGAIPFTNPGGGRQKWVPQAALLADPLTIAGVLVYDRLLHIGGLDGTLTTPQNVQSGSGVVLTRNTGGAGNQIFVEINAAVGTTATTISASYTNQDGTAGRTTPTRIFGGSGGGVDTDVNAFLPLPLQAGDTGVRSVETVTLGATTGTAGDFGVVVAHPVAMLFPYYAGSSASDFTLGPSGMPELEADACLATAVLAASTSESIFHLMLSTVEA